MTKSQYDFKAPGLRYKLRKDGILEIKYFSPESYFKITFKPSEGVLRTLYYNKKSERLYELSQIDGICQVIEDREKYA